MSEASWEQVLPAAFILPMTGRTMQPWASTRYPLGLLLEVPLAEPISDMAKGAVSSGCLLLTAI